MKAGLLGQQLSLMDELKAASFLVHAQIQTAPFFQALAACQLPLESYVGQLRALFMIHGVMEQALEHCSDERVNSVWTPDMCKLALLQDDLSFFEPRTIPDLKEAAEEAQKAVAALRQCTLDEPLALLGWIYVLEGSMLGARVLRPLYARAFLLDDTGLAYLGGYGDAAHSQWSRFQERMNALQLSAVQRELLTQTSITVLEQLEAIFKALYPFQPDSKVFLGTSINPEAGRHPIPDDELEIQASLLAADRCWQQFPYFEYRYGERGRRFARSDAAWLATLCSYEPAQISRQVRWLGRVLAGRGMPTLLLEIQLEMLAEELTSAIPGKQADFEKLSQAAVELHDSRSKHLSDDKVQSIADEFERTSDSQWRTRLPNTGVLLAAAVADEMDNISNAEDSMLAWMTDADRFPVTWIDAVECCISLARQQATSMPDTNVTQP